LRFQKSSWFNIGLYMGAALLANTAIADPATLRDLRDGDMRKLTVHAEPMRGSDVAFTAANGTSTTLADYAGKTVVLNFWATWCSPCRKEMPHLSKLQSDLGDQLTVLTVATGRNASSAIDRFFDEIDVTNLPKATDARQELARSFGVLGLPITIVLNAQGQEVARLQGDADWSSDNAKAILSAVAAQ
jgi:thiol-disulfide isomerase/thioredoxin